MSPVVMVGSAALIAAVLLLISYMVLTPVSHGRVRHNLLRGLEAGGSNAAPLVMADFPGRLIAFPGLVAHLERLLGGAGRPARWPLRRILNAKAIVAVAGLFLGLLLGNQLVGLQSLVVTLVLPVAGFFLPDVLLYNVAQKRRAAMTLALPDTLDQLSIAVEAGLGFDSAMAHVARNGKGPLADELVRVLQDVQVGQPRRDAYLALAERAGVPALRRFLRAVVQAEEYGIAMADVLFTQAKEMRIERRQNAETKAMKIPVKVTFPLVLFILPVLFIAVLGPAVINIMETLGGR